MIKVIASDMDGTLLNNNHTFSERTIKAIQAACDNGIRFMIVTGRSYVGAMQELGKTDIICDYIVSSGAEIRNPDHEIQMRINMGIEECQNIYNTLKEYPLGVMFGTETYNYMIGTVDEVNDRLLDYIKYFYPDLPVGELKEKELYRQMWEKTRIVPSFEDLKNSENFISKIFVVSQHLELLGKVQKELGKNSNIAVTSSLEINLEITNVKAQKGPILKEYIESLGYTMDEVMVLGDSLNDYSMLSMDFGATIAMENADPVIKSVCKYVTKSNEEDGVAYTIEEMLKMYDML